MKHVSSPVLRSTSPCPCGSGASYARCCQPFHRGETRPATAEKLMRSRYCAFVVHDADYLIRTWHETTRPPQIHLDRRQRWMGLRILATSGGSLLANSATVEFIAEYSDDGVLGELRELSRFVREAGDWLYVDGDVSDE